MMKMAKFRMACADMASKVRASRTLLRWTLALSVLSGWVLRVPAQETWRRSYGGYGSDVGRAVRQTPDGGYIVAGSTGSYGTGGDVYVLKLDLNGDIEWSLYDGGTTVDEAWDVAVVEDGYLVVGSRLNVGGTGYDGFLMYLEADGAIRWNRSYGGEDWDLLRAVSTDGERIVMAGTTYSRSGMGGEYWVLSTDMGGEVQWSRTGGGPQEDQGFGCCLTSDGGCAITGTSRIADGNTDALIVKLDGSGEEIYTTIFGTDSLDDGASVDELEDGTLALCGSTNGYETYQQILVARIALDGSVLAMNHVGQVRDWTGTRIRVRDQNTFAIAAYTTAYGLGENDFFLLLTDIEGNFTFGTTYGGVGDDRAFGMDLTDDGGYVQAGFTESYGPGPRAVFVVKIGADGLTSGDAVVQTFDPVGMEDRTIRRAGMLTFLVRSGEQLSLAGREGMAATVHLVDATGRTVWSEALPQGGAFTVPTLKPGSYVAQLQTEFNITLVARIMLIGQ